MRGPSRLILAIATTVVVASLVVASLVVAVWAMLTEP
jgi:hypothetical protein